jgi:hypothetical protein
MAEALKPCPFCGGEAHHNDGGGSVYGRFWWRVGCPDCGVSFADEERWDAERPGMLDPAYPPKHCFAAWNRRAPDEKDAEIARLREALDRSQRFEAADWYWRTMDPDDCGDSPEEAINRAMVGQFCVCEIASSFTGPTRYGFIAPVVDPESDDEEFVHFATQQEAIDAAKARLTTLT